MFKQGMPIFAKTVAVALSAGFVITGLPGLGGVSIGHTEICRSDVLFIDICRPILPSAMLLMLVAGGTIAFLVFARITRPSKCSGAKSING